MGTVPSAPRSNARPQEAAEYLIRIFVGETPFSLTSDFWEKILELPLDLHWPRYRVIQACEVFLQNNCKTRHLAKILIHLAWCLQKSVSTPNAPSIFYTKAANALYIASVFLKYLIENSKSDIFKELFLSLGETEPVPNDFHTDKNIEAFVVQSVLHFIGLVHVGPGTYLLHHELLNFMFVSMSAELRFGPSLTLKGMNPFINAAMAQETSLVRSVVQRLIVNYIPRPCISFKDAHSSYFMSGSHLGILERFGSAAANLMSIPFKYFDNSSSMGLRSHLADHSLHLLLLLINYQRHATKDEPDPSVNESTHVKGLPYFSDNPYHKALESSRDIESGGIVDMEGNSTDDDFVRFSFPSLFDTIGMCLTDEGEAATLLLYSLIQGNSDFSEYVLVRTDMDTLLMPMLETLYNASKKRSNQIYMLLIVFLILSQDSSFNASLHKFIIPSVPWYQERLLLQTSLGSLMVIIFIRIVNYNLSKLRDVYLHTNCLAVLANIAPHAHHLSSYASQRLLSLFDMLSRKYTKLVRLADHKIHSPKGSYSEGDNVGDDMTAELHIYTDFLRIVMEILNGILTYALPRNPEVVYAMIHRQEVFQPFKGHPRFIELLDNIYNVLDFFNTRMDSQLVGRELSVEKVLEVIIITSRSWRGEGMKIFTQLRFTYEQEPHPEEFFIPYLWQLVISRCGFKFNPDMIALFPVELPIEDEKKADSNSKEEKSV